MKASQSDYIDTQFSLPGLKILDKSTSGYLSQYAGRSDSSRHLNRTMGSRKYSEKFNGSVPTLRELKAYKTEMNQQILKVGSKLKNGQLVVSN